MLFKKDSFFDPFKITNISDTNQIDILPTENEVLPICISKSRIKHGGNSLNFIIEHSNKKFLLKAIRKSFAAHEFLIENTIRLNSIFKTPQPVKFQTGKYTYEDKNYIWIQQEFIDGKYFSGDKYEFFKVIELISDLYKHRYKISNIFGTSVSKINFHNEKIEEKFFEYVRRFRNEKKLYDILPVICQKLILTEKLSPINSILKKEETLACHIDLHPQNMIVDSNKNIFTLDIASFTNFPIKVALSFAIFKNFRHVVAKNGKLNNELIFFLKKAIYSIFSQQYEMEEILKSAQVEYMRRANNVFYEMEKFGNSNWIDNLSVQLAGVCETSYVFKNEQQSK